MKQVKDLNKKRVCDLSEDEKIAYIRRGNCITKISVGEDGKLKVSSEKVFPAS